MPVLRVGKADEKDIETTRTFLQSCELFWDTRKRYALRSLDCEWEEWDDEDEEKIELLKIRKSIAREDGVSESDVDNRLIIYEFIMRRYMKADCMWGRVVIAADLLIENCCDPTENHLAFYPGFELFHVAPEQ